MAATQQQQTFQPYRPRTGDSNRAFPGVGVVNGVDYNEKSLPPSPLPPMVPPLDTKLAAQKANSRPPSRQSPPRAHSRRSSSVSRRPLPADSPVNERDFQHIRNRLSQTSVSDVVDSYSRDADSRTQSRELFGTNSQRESEILAPPARPDDFAQPMHSPIFRHEPMTHGPVPVQQPQSAVLSSGDSQRSSQSSLYEEQRQVQSRGSSGSRGSGRYAQGGYYQQQQQGGEGYFPPQQQQGYGHAQSNSGGNGFDFGLQQGNGSQGQLPQQQQQQQQQYHPQQQQQQYPNNGYGTPRKSYSPTNSDDRGRHLAAPQPAYRRSSRPSSVYSYASNGSPSYRAPSAHSHDSRRSSVVDLAHHQQHMPAIPFDNSHLQKNLGANAVLLSNKKTLDMYRLNAKKTNDPNLQYELAIFMVQMAQAKDSPSPSPHPGASPTSPSSDEASKDQLLNEAFQILQSLSNKSPQAQYYLADAYTTGLFTKGKPDDKLAFPLFVSASKHGHPEAGYRAGLCYEFGWGCRRDYPKAVQFYRQAASKNHPGAMTRLGKACLNNDLGLENRYREGVKWLKRANDVADEQYPLAPYELGLLHERGYGEDVFEDPAYAAQLFTKAASLGHADAAYRMGDAYEHGKLHCPKDAALSVHFYTLAAAKEHPMAMMALCAWYLVGAEPVLEKNEEEAYGWALRAAHSGLPKAEYAVGYFTEMGIGCRRDALEANVWYVKAAEHGDERAKKRLQTIKENALAEAGAEKGKRKGKLAKERGEEGGCLIM